MSTNVTPGHESPGKTDESDAENIEADLALSELIDQHENTNWSEIPGISAAEAGAWTARLIEAQETIQEGQ